MCNPRRVEVRATRELAQAWREEVARTARARGVALGEARLVHPLGTALGVPARRMFERGLEADTRWEFDGQAHRFEVDGGYALYYPDTGELELVATLEADVEVSATVTDEVSGVLRATFEATREANYYDDGYGGRTRTAAERQARQQAEAEAERQARAHVDTELARVRQDAVAARGEQLVDEAEAAAQQRLAARTAARRAELGQQAAGRLEGMLGHVQLEVNQRVAAAYRDAVLAYARQHGAEALTYTESNGVIDIQFELEA